MARAAYCGPGASMAMTRSTSIHTGLPGGWPISRRYAADTYSGQSQNDTVGATVSQYVATSIKNAPHDTQLSADRYFFSDSVIGISGLVGSARCCLSLGAHRIAQEVLVGEAHTLLQFSLVRPSESGSL